jgi:2-oxoisovalerate dehydrogenase E2 component (dihydrolipoyl transacylase)
MSHVFLLPDLGEGLTEAEVVGWRVAVGDEVAVDQVVIEVETAKASVELPCPYAGTVQTLHAGPGDVVPVGLPLITVEPADDGAGVTYREEERAGSGSVLIGYGTSNEPARRRRTTRVSSAAAVNGTASAPTAPAVAPTGPTPGQPLVISPLVRRLARDHDVALADLQCTGPGGVVLRRDVERAIARSMPATRATARDDRSPDDDVRTPLRGARRAVAEKLTQSRREIPDVTIWVEADATMLLAARDELRAAGLQVSLLALLARITILGLKRFPQLNSRIDPEAHEIVQLGQTHLGIAAQTDRGLIVPVVRDADTLSLVRLSEAIADVVERGRAGALAPAELTGGTFTLNNYGVFGVDGSTPIINPPEVGIVGVGRIVDRPWAVDGRLEVRKVTHLVLAFDHRVCDGGVAGGFLRFVADCIESPLRLLGEPS